MDKLKPIGRNLGRVFDSRLGHACKGHAIEHVTKQPNLTLKTQPKQLLGSLPLAFVRMMKRHVDVFTSVSYPFFSSMIFRQNKLDRFIVPAYCSHV